MDTRQLRYFVQIVESGSLAKASRQLFIAQPALVDYAKANPGRISYTTTGPGTTMHVAFQLVEKQAGLEWTHVPYPAAKQGLAAVIGGHVQVSVGSTQWVPEVREGSLRLLAVIADKRMKAFAAVPTLRELGYDFAAGSGCTLVAPKATPPAQIAKLNEAVRKAMDDPEFQQLLRNLYHDPTYRGGEELKRYLEAAHTEFVRMVAELKIPTEFDAK